MNDSAYEMSVYRFLGLCFKAGCLTSGETGVLNAVRSGNAKLVIIASDAFDNTRKKFTDKCGSYKVPLRTFGNAEGLGHAIGKDKRVVIAVTDAGFSEGIIKRLNEAEGR